MEEWRMLIDWLLVAVIIVVVVVIVDDDDDDDDVNVLMFWLWKGIRFYLYILVGHIALFSQYQFDVLVE